MGADLEARFARGELVSKKASNGMIAYNRQTFNRMNNNEQAAYMRRLEAKRYYWLEDAEGTGHAVAKVIFDAANLPLALHSIAA
ncbi:MAG: hypothetical protein E5W82_10580 [Mesorhizobium sp.]|nr:MAG: hypothetical protein E5W82_10580 [Mesorhizobium sp.]